MSGHKDPCFACMLIDSSPLRHPRARLYGPHRPACVPAGRVRDRAPSSCAPAPRRSTLRLPTQSFSRLGRIAQQIVYFGRPEIARVGFNVLRPIEPAACRRYIQKFANRMRFAGRDHVIVRLGLLQHQPHRFDVVAGIAPIARASRFPRNSFFCSPILMRPSARVILRVTKVSPRRSDS